MQILLLVDFHYKINDVVPLKKKNSLTKLSFKKVE